MFFLFFHSGGAWAQGPQAAPPRMKKKEKQISLRTFDKDKKRISLRTFDTKVLILRSKKILYYIRRLFITGTVHSCHFLC